MSLNEEQEKALEDVRRMFSEEWAFRRFRQRLECAAGEGRGRLHGAMSALSVESYHIVGEGSTKEGRE